MVQYSIGALLIGLALLAIALQRLYSSIPARELKRLGSRGDPLARTLYRVAAYGSSLRLFLWLLAVAGLAGGFLLIVPRLAPWAGFILLSLVLGTALVVLPMLTLTQRSAHFAAFWVPVFAGLLQHLHPLLHRSAALINRFRELAPHSRLYEKEDLLSLLDQQKEQTDNRILAHDLELAERAVQFGDRQASDIVLTAKETYTVNADDAIGPVLLDQLHKQGQQHFLVYKDDPGTIIGTLAMSDAIRAKHGGRVFDLVQPGLMYAHEDFSLHDVLDAFQKTGQHIVMVINSFEEYVGVITFDRLVEELFGTASTQSDIAYANRSEVAAYRPQPEQEQEADLETESKQSPSVSTTADTPSEPA